MNKIIFIIISIFFSFSAYADISDANKSKAWDCSGIYMANYFLQKVISHVDTAAVPGFRFISITNICVSRE